MASKIKTIIISLVVIIALILAYVFFFKKSSVQTNLTSSTSVATTTTGASAPIDTEFLSILLSVKDIKLNDAIFSDSTFNNLRDSSITLTQDGTEGRKNPFAPIGVDAITSTTVTPDLLTPKSTTGVTTPNPTVVPPATKKN